MHHYHHPNRRRTQCSGQWNHSAFECKNHANVFEFEWNSKQYVSDFIHGIVFIRIRVNIWTSIERSNLFGHTSYYDSIRWSSTSADTIQFWEQNFNMKSIVDLSPDTIDACDLVRRWIKMISINNILIIIHKLADKYLFFGNWTISLHPYLMSIVRSPNNQFLLENLCPRKKIFRLSCEVIEDISFWPQAFIFEQQATSWWFIFVNSPLTSINIYGIHVVLSTLKIFGSLNNDAHLSISFGL